MKEIWLIVTLGFALFSMFFGSGNLVFPILLGQESNGHYLSAAAGIAITGVLVPFLGVFGMLMYDGNLNAFFNSFGKRGTFLFSLMALSLLGPFGVVARCLTVSHGALTPLFQDLSLPMSSLILSIVIFLLAIKKNQIIALLGNIFTPFLLLSLAAIAFFGLRYGPAVQTNGSPHLDILKNGIFQGYQTMDLLAAFFFSKFVINHLRGLLKATGKESRLFQIFSKSTLFGMGLLTAIYVALVALGATYSELLAGKPPQEMLGIIAFECLGWYAAPCVCLVIVFACVTTAIVLASLFAEFLNKEITNEKLGGIPSLLITLAISFCVSTLDFNGIAKIIGPIVEIIYPALIAMTLIKIGSRTLELKAGV